MILVVSLPRYSPTDAYSETRNPHYAGRPRWFSPRCVHATALREIHRGLTACRRKNGQAHSSAFSSPANTTAGLDGVFPSPLPGRSLVSRPVRLVHVGDLGHKRVIGVGVCQHGADGQQDCKGGELLSAEVQVVVRYKSRQGQR